MSPYSEFALGEDEEKQNLILACRSVPWSDCEIKILTDEEDDENNNLEIKSLECKVVNLKKVTNDIYVIILSIDNKIIPPKAIEIRHQVPLKQPKENHKYK